jgi:signal transduction histidine kinase/CheY-like chemotaxis protein
MGRRIRGTGLTARAAIGASAVFVPFVAALVYLSIAYFQRQYEQGIGGHQFLLVSRIAADLDQRLFSATHTLERIAQGVDPRLLSDPAAAQRFLDERITLHLLFDQGLRLVARDRRLLVASPPAQGERGTDLSRDECAAAVARTGRPAISRPFASASPGGAVVITVAVPIRDGGGATIGQLHGAVRVDGADILGDLAKVRIGKGGYFVILTRQRIRVSHPDPARVFGLVPGGANRAADLAIDEGFEGVTETVSSAGLSTLTAVKRLSATDWILFANIPLEEVRAPFRAARLLYAGVVAAGVGLLVVAVWLSLRRVTRPLVELIGTIEAIAARPEPGRRIGAVGAGEADRLASAVDRLLVALDAREEAQRRAVEERHALEVKLQQQHRLDSLGVLAGGIAHDFNNLLTPIIANASLAANDAAPGSQLRRDMEEIVSAARRGAELGRRILTFSRRQVLETRVLDLNEELKSLEKPLRALAGAAVEVRVETAPVAAEVRADPTLLQQAILNLASNAREAMPGGGTLTVGVAVPGLDGRTAWEARSRPEGRYALVTVTDTGAGIEPEILPRIFEPFFTTRGRAKGTGLGLATVHGIVQEHGGAIEVSSAPGLGTHFRLFLPLAEPRTERPPSSPAEAVPTQLRILLVEDEPLVRALAGRILRRAGHEVTGAATPIEALGLANVARPDLLVTDVLLPEMDGIELHRRLQLRWPGLRVLFMSGFPGGHAQLEDAIARGEHFLQKPFEPGELIEKVRAAATG